MLVTDLKNIVLPLSHSHCHTHPNSLAWRYHRIQLTHGRLATGSCSPIPAAEVKKLTILTIHIKHFTYSNVSSFFLHLLDSRLLTILYQSRYHLYHALLHSLFFLPPITTYQIIPPHLRLTGALSGRNIVAFCACFPFTNFQLLKHSVMTEQTRYICTYIHTYIHTLSQTHKHTYTSYHVWG